MKDEMMLVGVTLARRYTRKQKGIFLAEVCRQCREVGWKTEFQLDGRRNFKPGIPACCMYAIWSSAIWRMRRR